MHKFGKCIINHNYHMQCTCVCNTYLPLLCELQDSMRVSFMFDDKQPNGMVRYYIVKYMLADGSGTKTVKSSKRA